MNLTTTIGFTVSKAFDGGSGSPMSEAFFYDIKLILGCRLGGSHHLKSRERANIRNSTTWSINHGDRRKKLRPFGVTTHFGQFSFYNITCKAQGPHNASREYVAEKRSLGLHFKDHGTLSKDSLKHNRETHKAQVAGKESIVAAGIKSERTSLNSNSGRNDFRGGTVTPFKW